MALLHQLASWLMGRKFLTASGSRTIAKRQSAIKPSFSELESENVCLQDILKARAISNRGAVICYFTGDTTTAKEFSCLELYTEASQYSRIIRKLPGFQDGKPVVLHLDEQWDAIVWFWAVLLANGVPVLSPPLSHIDDHRHRHIWGLSDLLQSPICITRNKLSNLFDGAKHLLQLHTIEALCCDTAWTQQHGSTTTTASATQSGQRSSCLKYQGGQGLAMLMLTSGSTGNAKAVCLSHRQVLAAISGKAAVRPLPTDGSFLNWIGLDHVASLVEIHLQALWLGVDQVHVNAADVVSCPQVFLDLLTRHRICRTFAPNFFLARLVSVTEQESDIEQKDTPWDLSNLKVVASGGESNDIQTCLAASSLFRKYGASHNVITPGFGMTETCAGSIFNLSCPDYDITQGYASASLGKCMRGIEMRVMVGSRLATTDEIGDLEVRGDVVFNGYYRNAAATAEAFPWKNEWFRTGDEGCIDPTGNLRLFGRKKEVININGIKIVIADIGSLLDKALGNKTSRLMVFPSRAVHTEQITIAYVPRDWPQESDEMAEIDELAIQTCLAGFYARPLVFSISQASLPLLPLSSLGKVSRSKMTSLFEDGVFDEDVAIYRQKLAAHKKDKNQDMAATESELLLLDDFAKVLGVDLNTIGPETRLYDVGFTSMDLIRLKRRIDSRLGMTVPVITLMKNPTARSLARALDSEPRLDNWSEKPKQSTTDYDPVVILKPSGTKTPLWLIHPGVGEVLVFVGLAQHLADDDRPIYALRARGFEPGQGRFSSIDETVDTYVEAIRQKQPQGPYALAGYSYGAMLAFETAKRIQAGTGGTADSLVRFLGSFNLPPHIKSRMRQLSWNMCLLHLTQFLGLTTEEDVEDMARDPGFSTAAREDSLAQVLGASDRHRMDDLGLGDAALARWADVAYGLQSMAREYEPSGRVDGIDVFHAIPLKRAAASREEWVDVHLSRWKNFSRTEPRMHAVGGAHYTMIAPDHVVGFAAKLKEALRARGI